MILRKTEPLKLYLLVSLYQTFRKTQFFHSLGVTLLVLEPNTSNHHRRTQSPRFSAAASDSRLPARHLCPAKTSKVRRWTQGFGKEMQPQSSNSDHQ